MLDETKLREKLAKILERTQYHGLHTFARNPLIDATLKAVKECEEEASLKSKIKRTLKRK